MDIAGQRQQLLLGQHLNGLFSDGLRRFFEVEFLRHRQDKDIVLAGLSRRHQRLHRPLRVLSHMGGDIRSLCRVKIIVEVFLVGDLLLLEKAHHICLFFFFHTLFSYAVVSAVRLIAVRLIAAGLLFIGILRFRVPGIAAYGTVAGLISITALISITGLAVLIPIALVPIPLAGLTILVPAALVSVGIPVAVVGPTVGVADGIRLIAGLVLEGAVELSIRRRLVGAYPENADNIERNGAENFPADEGQIKNEDVPLVPVRHFTRAAEDLLHGHIGILRQQIWNHAILIPLDNSGNNEEQGPEKNIKVPEKYNLYDVPVVDLEADTDIVEIPGFALSHDKDAPQADFEGAKKKNRKKNSNNEYRNEDTGKQNPDGRVLRAEDVRKRAVAESGVPEFVHRRIVIIDARASSRDKEIEQESRYNVLPVVHLQHALAALF